MCIVPSCTPLNRAPFSPLNAHVVNDEVAVGFEAEAYAITGFPF